MSSASSARTRTVLLIGLTPCASPAFRLKMNTHRSVTLLDGSQDRNRSKGANAPVERCHAALDASDFATVRMSFAPDAVAERNEKQTMVGVDAKPCPYEALFKATKFNTDFQYDAADIGGDVASVRNRHPVEQTKLVGGTGRKTPNFNRETFVQRRFGPDWSQAWRIVLHAFCRQPRQGEQWDCGDRPQPTGRARPHRKGGRTVIVPPHSVPRRWLRGRHRRSWRAARSARSRSSARR